MQVMTYHTYELSSDLALGLRCFGRGLKEIWSPWVQSGYAKPATWFWAAGEMMARAGLTHHRPAYDIGKVSVGNQDVEVSEETAFRTPFGTLTHFAKEIGVQQPRVLLVAPLSGHFATLLRHTVRTLVTDHDVYITDWANAREVPTAAGRFGFDDYVDHVVRFLDHIGPGSHIVAVCQPAVQTLAAAALMGESRASSNTGVDDTHGRTGRYQHQSDQGEQACRQQADFVVRGSPHRDRASPSSRSRPEGVSRLPATYGLHVDECGPTRERPS